MDGDGQTINPALPGLLEAASKGDEQAWRSIVELYARRVYALARSRLGGFGKSGAGGRRTGASGGGAMDQPHDVAEEITQSVFVTVAAKLSGGEYTEQGRFEPWLFRVAMNRVRDEVRRVRRQATATDPEVLGQRAGREDDGRLERDDERRDSMQKLRRAMEELGDADREIVELRHHAQMSFKQISEMLEEPMGTLLARHHRALRKLKELMLVGDEPGGRASQQAEVEDRR